MKNVEDMEDLEKSKEEELAENAERIQNTISLIKKLACVLAMIAATFMFFYARSDYNNYSGSQLVMAEVIDIEGDNDENIVVRYRYNISGKEYESNKIQSPEKIKKGDKKEIRVKKNNPKVILKFNDINYVVLCDVLIGLCLGLTVLCLYELDYILDYDEISNAGFTTTPGVTFASIMEENKKKNEKINTEKKI